MTAKIIMCVKPPVVKSTEFVNQAENQPVKHFSKLMAIVHWSRREKIKHFLRTCFKELNNEDFKDCAHGTAFFVFTVNIM